MTTPSPLLETPGVDIPLADSLRSILATTDRAALLELITAAYAAWETHYSGGYLYTDDPDAVALFNAAREQYRAWRDERVEQLNISLAKLPVRRAFTARLRGLMPDVTGDELLLLEVEHGLDVDDTTACAWVTSYRERQLAWDAFVAQLWSAT